MPEFGVVDNSRFPPINLPENDVLDIELFSSMYMKRRFTDDNGRRFPWARMHREFFYVWSHPELYSKVIYVAPRGYYKSSIAEIGVVYDIVHRGPLFCPEYLVLGASQPLAEQRLKGIKWELSENEELLAEYTRSRSYMEMAEKWTDDEIIFPMGYKDPDSGKKKKRLVKVVAKGRGTSMRGLHPIIILADDLEKEGETGRLSPVEIENIASWFKGSVVGMMLSERGQIWLQGNYLQYDSFLHKAYRAKDWGGNWFRMKYQARKADGKSSWPERYSDEFLFEKEATMGVLKFAAEWINDPMASENPLIIRQWLRYFEESELPPMLYKIMAFDPAQSTKEQANYSAWDLIGADCTPGNREELYFNMDCGRGHWDLDERIRRIFAINEHYRPDEIRIENNAFQDDMVVMVEKESERRGIHLPIVRVRRGPGGNLPKDKVTALDAVSPLIKLGNVRFRKSQGDLIDELLAFPGATNDDQVDAFTTALDGMKHKWVDKVQEYAKRHYAHSGASGPAMGDIGF